MTMHDIEIGDTWLNPRGRRVEIACVRDFQVEGGAITMVAYRAVGMQMVHLVDATEVWDTWTKEVE